MSSVRLPLNIPSMEEESHAPTDLSGRIRAFCKEQKEKRKQEWESLKIALDKMKESKGKHLKQPDELREGSYLFPNGTKHGKNKNCSKEYHKQSIYYFC